MFYLNYAINIAINLLCSGFYWVIVISFAPYAYIDGMPG